MTGRAIRNRLTFEIKKEAARLGFSACGTAKATFLEQEARYLEHWLSNKRHSSMRYMENHFEKRTDPRKLVPGARSVICVLKNYYPNQTLFEQNDPKISRYAYGTDYHYVVKEDLRKLLSYIQTKTGGAEGRCFVDSAPVMDKVWAARSGLGWIGKHTNLLRKSAGSWFFIGSIILDAELAYDEPVTDHCGSCTRCIDACPTKALTPYEIDAGKCISYLTIEKKESVPESFVPNLEGWAFGCDICQEVCPWNRFSAPHEEARFTPFDWLQTNNFEEWAALSKSQFSKRTKSSPISRVKHEKWLNNLEKAARSLTVLLKKD